MKFRQILKFSVWIFIGIIIFIPFLSPIILKSVIVKQLKKSDYIFLCDRISYIFPIGFEFKNTEFKHNNNDIVLKIKNLTVKPYKFFKYFIFKLNIDFSNLELIEKYGSIKIGSGSFLISGNYKNLSGLFQKINISEQSGWNDISMSIAFGKVFPQIFLDELLFDISITNAGIKINRINSAGNINGKISGNIKTSPLKYYNISVEFTFNNNFIFSNNDFIRRIEKIKKINTAKILYLSINADKIGLDKIILKN
ncbi:hypothetical protein KA977_06500 [Candidatus Dependentiae bacterium]|nr:hypothetical protein [Candidatus Dependentiae bacterium]